MTVDWNWSSKPDLGNWEIGFGRVGRRQVVLGKLVLSCVEPVKTCQAWPVRPVKPVRPVRPVELSGCQGRLDTA